MPFFDLPLAKLRTYRVPDKPPRDFAAFWKRTLAETAAFPLNPRFLQHSDPIYRLVDVYNVTFRGYMGQHVKGWFIEPAGNTAPLPCIITFVGYGGGRSLPIDHVMPAAAGFAHLVMDTRGQGSSWSPGDTPDEAPSGPAVPGFMTRGIDNPDHYYYRRVYTDAVRAVQSAAAHPHVDPARLAVTGASQGGGIAIAAAGLLRNRIKLVMADVPYLCHFRRATTLIDTQPYAEIVRYLNCHRDLIDQTFHTLSYFDGLHFAPRITARALFSAGLMDTICPPSCVFAAYNRVQSKKSINLYEFNNHEGGGPFQALQRLHHARQYL